MIKPDHKKITIVGNAGSGKTTLAFQLQAKLKLPLYHLDLYYWLPGWQRIGFERFQELQTELCEKDEWIIEGAYIGLVHERIFHADVIIFLDMPRYLCIWSVINRAIRHFGAVIPGSPQECKQQLFGMKFFQFLRWVWDFNKRYQQIITFLLEEYSDSKQIYLLRSRQQLDDFVRQMGDQPER